MPSNQIAKKPDWRGRLIRYAPILLWTGVILFLSTSQASMAETSRFIRPLIEFFFPSAAPDTFLLIHAFIRKTAHFVEYAVLGLFAARAFSNSSVNILRKYWTLFSVAIVVLIAVIDEINQSLGTSRTGSVWDALLDISGGISAILVFYLIRGRIRTSQS